MVTILLHNTVRMCTHMDVPHRSAGFVEECPVSVAVHSFAGETIIIALCRDLKLRLWSCQVGNVGMRW